MYIVFSENYTMLRILFEIFICVIEKKEIDLLELFQSWNFKRKLME